MLCNTFDEASSRLYRVVLYFIYVFVLNAISSCREPFDVKIKPSELNALVVEGNVNSGLGPTLIKLSRTSSVDTVGLNPETGAQVIVEGEDKSSTIISDMGNGSYVNPQLSLSHQIRYRLHINTALGEEYISDYSLPLQTPLIDSLNWNHDALGVHVFLTTHDPSNKLNFYRWKYTETWEIHSVQHSYTRYVTDTIFVPRTRGDTDSAFTCYLKDSSTTILASSSSQLGNSVINQVAIARVNQGDEKIAVRYSISVSQFAQSSAGYEFYQNLKKNSELTGSIYSPQPSNLFGNIHTIKGGKMGIGFIEVSDEQSKRLFISKAEVSTTNNYWGYKSGCLVRGMTNARDTILLYFPLSYEVLYPETIPGNSHPYAYLVAEDKRCGDCRLRGTPIKPSYW